MVGVPIGIAGTYLGLMAKGASVSVLKGVESGTLTAAHLVDYVDLGEVADVGRTAQHNC